MRFSWATKELVVVIHWQSWTSRSMISGRDPRPLSPSNDTFVLSVKAMTGSASVSQSRPDNCPNGRQPVSVDWTETAGRRPARWPPSIFIPVWISRAEWMARTEPTERAEMKVGGSSSILCWSAWLASLHVQYNHSFSSTPNPMAPGFIPRLLLFAFRILKLPFCQKFIPARPAHLNI